MEPCRSEAGENGLFSCGEECSRVTAARLGLCAPGKTAAWFYAAGLCEPGIKSGNFLNRRINGQDGFPGPAEMLSAMSRIEPSLSRPLKQLVEFRNARMFRDFRTRDNPLGESLMQRLPEVIHGHRTVRKQVGYGFQRACDPVAPTIFKLRRRDVALMQNKYIGNRRITTK